MTAPEVRPLTSCFWVSHPTITGTINHRHVYLPLRPGRSAGTQRANLGPEFQGEKEDLAPSRSQLGRKQSPRQHRRGAKRPGQRPDTDENTADEILGILGKGTSPTRGAFWYAWLFNHTRGSILLVIAAHSVEGSIQAGGWFYMGVWLAVAIGLVLFDWKAWRAPAPTEATTQPRPPQAMPPKGAAPATPA